MADLRQALKDFVATSNSGKYADEATILSKFPELQNYDVNILKDFVATSNSGKYETEDELFSKFPEFNLSAQVPVEQELKKKEGTTVLPSGDGGSVLQPSKRNIPLFESKELESKGQVSSDATRVTNQKIEPIESAPESVPEKKQTYVENLFTNLGLGASYFNEAIASIPESTINLLAIPQNYIADKTGWDIGVTAEGIKESWGITNPLLDYVKESQEIMNGTVSKFIADRYEDPSIVGNFQKGNYQDGFELLGSAITQSVPVSIGLMIGGAYTAPSKLATVATIGFTENQREELAEMDPTMSEAEKTLKAGAMAAAESVFSAISTGTIGKVYKDIAKKEGTEAAKGILKDGLVLTYKKALEKGGALTGFVGEGIEEAATQITQNVISGKPAFEGAADAFVTGAGSGVVFTAPISAYNAKKYIDNKVESYQTKDKIGKILGNKADDIDILYNVPVSSEITAQQLEVANLPKSRDILVVRLKKAVADNKITENDAKQSLFVFDKTQQVSNAVKDLDVSADNKAKIATLLRQRDDLKTKIQNKDDVLVVQEKQKIEEINNQIQEILSAPQQEAPSYKVDGKNVSIETIDELIKTKSREELLAMNIEIKNDQTGVSEKLQDLIGTKPIEIDAVQEQAASQVPVQPETIVSETVEGGIPESGTQVTSTESKAQEEVSSFKPEDKVVKDIELIEILDDPQTEVSKEVKSEIDVLREQEQAELSQAIPNSDQYKVDGVIDGEKITDPADKKIFEEIYNKYDKLISPLLEQQKKEVVSSKTQEVVNKNASELLSNFDKGTFINVNKLGEIQPPSDSPINKIYEEFKKEFRDIKIGGRRPTEGAAFYNINQKTIELNKNSDHWKEIDTSNLIATLAHEYVHHKIETNDNVKRIEKDLLDIKNDLINNPPELQDDNDRYIFPFIVLKTSSPQEVMTYAVSNPEIRKYLTKYSDKLNEISQEIFNIDIIEPQKVEKNERSTEQVQPELTGDGGRGRIESSELTPLQGAPSVQGATGPDPGLVAVAKLYAENNGIDLKRQSEYVEVSEERAKRIASEYEKMVHDPQNPEVKEAYDELIKQTKAQYQALVDAGYKFWFLDLNKQDNLEYISSPYNAMRDLRNNKQMGVFPTTNGFGTAEIDVNDNPFLEDTGIRWGLGGIDGEIQPVLANDLFRAVHDAFGHGLEGAGFRARGEENAWQAHVRLFTGKAIGAITSETRGQNSWVNYGPYGESNRTASAEDTVFADQKTGLMPEWTWTEGRAGDMGIDSSLDSPDQVSGKLDELLSLDPKESGTAQKIIDGIDRLIKDYEKIEKGGLGVNIALPAIKAILKGIRSLIQAGMNLNDAIKKAAQDNNVSVRDVVNGINAVSQIAPIQVEYDALMTKADNMIKRQKSRGVTDKKILSNVEAMIRKSELYTNANDTQRKIMETEVRDKMGVGPRKSASIGRVIGVLKDINNVTKKEKLKIISRIRELSRDVAKELTNEIRDLAKQGNISTAQAVNIISKLGKVNMLNEISVSNFVDYMAKVFNDADYDNKINVAKGKLKNARKNIATKIGIADGLMLPLQRLFSVDPSIIPDAYLEKYLELVEMFSARQAVLTLDEKSSVKKDVDQILNEINNEQSRADELSEIFAESDNKVFDEDNLDYSASLKKMLSEGEITDDDLKLMKKYKQDILPEVETAPLSEEEINKKKSDQISEIKKVPIDSTGLPSQDERNLANRLAKLIKNTSEKDLMKLSTTDLKNLLKVADNINKNYLPHYTQIMVEKINAISSGKTLVASIKRAVPLKLSAAYSRIKSAIIRSQKGGLSEMVRRNALFNIDQVFGDFKTKDIFNSLFEKAAEGEAKFKAELKKVQNILENAEAKVAKSFKLDPDETLMSKFKMMTYMIQLEYESNKGSEQVNPAIDYLKETIKHIDSGKSRFGERDANMLQDIIDNYEKDGNIDLDELFNSFNNAEKDAIKDIRGINESLKDKAQYTAAIIRGDAIDTLNNYVHLNVLHDTQPLDASASIDFLNQANNSRKPSTKAKSLISRTKGAKPLNFDVFASAQRGAKFVLLDYNLTEPIRTARRSINFATKELTAEGRLSKTQREVKNAIENAFEETLDNLLTNSILQNSLADEAIDFISKQGYRAVLAGTGRFAAELTSNVSFALLADPKAFNSGFKYKDIIMSTDAPLIMENVNSKQTNRIFPSDTLSGKFIDTSILNQASGIQGSASKNPVFNKMQQIYNLTGKKYKNSVELVADSIISTPDKIVMRPMWFGSFANEFKKITGKDVDFKKIAANDQNYIDSNQDAIDQAKRIADQMSVFTGATDNSFMGILKGAARPDQSVSTRAFNNFNNYMSRFLIFEYITARTAIYALAGDGTITKTQGAALLAGVATRMTVYTLLSQMLANGIMGLFGAEDEEELDEKSLMQKIGQSLTSTFTSLLIGRDFGNATKLAINYGLEEINEKYLDFLREGDYDPYKDGIAYSLIPREETKKTSLSELLINMGGSFTPALKTASLVVENMSAIPEVLRGGTTKKEADAIEREERVVKERIPLEIFGNMGLVPLYKDVRRAVNKSIYASINEAKKSADRNKSEQKELLGGYENKTDLKRYNPKLYEKNFGEKSEYYKKTKDEREKQEAEEKLNRKIKDRIYNYKPDDDGFGSGGFSKKEKRKNKSNDGFGGGGFGKD